MQVNQVLWFDNRADFKKWLDDSKFTIDKEEFTKDESKLGLLVPPMVSIVDYTMYTNYFSCDMIQSVIWATRETVDEKGTKVESQIQIVPIFIASDKL